MRVVVLDSTRGWLSVAYALWARLAVLLGRLDRAVAVASWAEAEVAVISGRLGNGIVEISFVGHGRPGSPLIAGRPLDTAAAKRLCEVLRPALARVAVLWWRSCSVAAGAAGETFVARCALHSGVTVLAHLDEIGPWQGGLVAASGSDSVDLWSLADSEGAPRRWWQLPRGRWVTCLRMRAPDRPAT